MKSELEINLEWANSHMAAIVDVLKQNAMHLLTVRVASPEQDLKRATDLVLSVDGGDVAVRIRRPEYYKYQDLTIRTYNGGYRTELDKIKDGWGDWYLYGWSNGCGGLVDWILVSLNKLRESGLLDKPDEVRTNRDGRTGFYAYDVETLQRHQCLVSQAKG